MSSVVNADDVVIKDTEPLRVAEVYGVAAGLAPEHIGPVFSALSPKLIDHLRRAGARPGVLIHYYDQPTEDGTVGVHVGYEIGEQPVPPGDGVEITDLPVIQVASFIYRGGMSDIVQVYKDLIRSVEDSGYRLTGNSRELYHEMGADGPHVTELQLPVTK